MEKINSKQILDDLFRALIVILTSAVYALTVVWFLEPAGLLAIGATALGQIFSRLFGLANINIPVGVFVLIINIPLTVYGIKKVSPRFAAYTILSIIVQTILMMGFIPQIDLGINGESDRLFLTIIAALFAGAAIGIALRYGTSTGGVDILAQGINLKKNISIGVFSTVLNIVLACIGGLIAQNLRITLYTFIFIIISNLAVDKIHTAYNYLRIDVITKNKELVSQALLKGINRGCTYVEATGAYTHETKSDVFMVISSYELYKAKKIIKSVDKTAFIIVSPVKRIIGAFFKHTII